MAKPVKTIKVKKANAEAKVEEPVKTSKTKKATKVEEPKVEEKKKKGSKIPIQVKEKVEEVDSKKKTSKKEKKETKTIQVEREVKYAYPEDINDSMTRKKFRHECRAKKQRFENELGKIKDKKSKEYLAKEKEYKAFLSVTFK